MNLSFKQKFADGEATNFVAKIWAGFIESDNYGFFLNWIWENEMIISNIDNRYLDETLKPKLHTIREDKTDRWTAGKLIHFIINNRSANRFQFAPVIPVVSTQQIEIRLIDINKKTETVVFYKTHRNGFTVSIDGKTIDHETMYTIAQNDGFETVDSFFKYFDREFTGKIIHWTNINY